ncbi:MAG: redox-sensing transcriptional repressor Rex [Bacteroidales bacterium]|nr:redox-sensing transcriptional repressor Rex [Bacteroidales bacterium]
MEILPERTVERLSHYRRVLSKLLEINKEYIYSHEIAKLLHITPVQVRRDLMLIGHSGTLRKGYRIRELISLIGTIIDNPEKYKVAIVGFGKLGHALLNYLTENESNLHLVALFDTNPEKIGTTNNNVICYSVDRIPEIIKRYKIDMALLTLPPQFAQLTANQLVESGVKGIINYTSSILSIEGAFLEQYDMIASLEKVAYFTKPEFYL